MNNLMSISILGIFFVFSSTFSKNISTDHSKILSTKCPENCSLPDCLCPSILTPSGLTREETPQLVLLTFDDTIEEWMYPLYDRIIQHDGLKSANGCPISMTFFVSHWSELVDGQPVRTTNYELVNRLYNKGHEMASHSVTHLKDLLYWRNGSMERWVKEIGTQRDFLSTFANIPKENIKGFRAPSLEVGGDITYEALRTLGMTYDSSMSTMVYRNPPPWPFTLDNGSPLDCIPINCPTGKFKGIWEFPLIWFDDLKKNGDMCAMPDFGCSRPPNSMAAFEYFMEQYKIFNGTRTLFGVYQHAYWFRESPHVFEGFLMFLEHLSGLDDVYFVTMSQALDWLKNPLTITQLKKRKLDNPFACPARPPAECKPRNCTYAYSMPYGGKEINITSCTDSCPKILYTFPVNSGCIAKTGIGYYMLGFFAVCLTFVLSHRII